MAVCLAMRHDAFDASEIATLKELGWSVAEILSKSAN
jgi:hypothetical protein